MEPDLLVLCQHALGVVLPTLLHRHDRSYRWRIDAAEAPGQHQHDQE